MIIIHSRINPAKLQYICFASYLKGIIKSILLFKPATIQLTLIFFSILSFSNDLNAEQRSKNMQCVCKLAKGSLCHTPVDEKTDSTETFWWTQTIIYEPGVTTQHDFNLACWENRNDEKYG